jgi:hypothetical protein
VLRDYIQPATAIDYETSKTPLSRLLVTNGAFIVNIIPALSGLHPACNFSLHVPPVQSSRSYSIRLRYIQIFWLKKSTSSAFPSSSYGGISHLI